MWSDWVDGVKLFVWTGLVLVLGATVGLIGSGVIDLGDTFSFRKGAGDRSPGLVGGRDTSLSREVDGSGGNRARRADGAENGDFADVARVVGPAVVSIEVRRRF